MNDARALLWAYGVVSADAPEPGGILTGVDDAPVRLVALDGLLVIVSDVQRARYEESLLEERMRDVAWVGERGVAHERVLTWFVDRGPVVPFTLFSLHDGDDALRSRLDERRDVLAAAIEHVRGRREWGIKVWRDEERFLGALGGRSPALASLDTEIADASPGRRFLLERKRDTLRTEEGRRLSAAYAQDVYAALAELAVDARALSLPAAPRAATRVLVLHAAFLVADQVYPEFERRVQQLAARDAAAGFDWEFTGPWPPYHFTDLT